MHLKSLLFAAVLLVAGQSPVVAAPPFNCSIALEPAEIAICDSADLSLLDREMNRLYIDKRKALKAEGKLDAAEALRLDQRAFLKIRNECGYEMPCLTERYKRRNELLAKP